LKPEIVNIHAKLNAGDIHGAMELARDAYINDVMEPIVLDLVAHRLEEQGDLHGAIRLLIQASQLEPQNASLHANIGHCLLKLSRPTHALEAFNRALKLDPKSPRAHHGAGLALWGLKDIDACEHAQIRALKLDPNYPDPVGTLALIAYERKQYDRAQALADKALTLNPSDHAALIVKSHLLFESGEIDACADLLSGVLQSSAIAPLQRASLVRKYADALDARQRYDEAFEAYASANALLRGVYADLYDVPDVETGQQLCARLIDYFQDYVEPPTKFAPDFAKNGAREHVFLMGFPRSGTTLLEQILASHSDVIALEERATLHDPIMRYFMDDRDIGKLMQAPEAELQTYRDKYWSEVDRFGIADVANKVFVDKQPSLTLYLPLIKRLFPNAKILFCIRDPRDVVLSCFRRSFTMNGTIFQYTQIDSLAKFYASTMDLGHLYFEKIAQPVHRHSHEFLISNFDEEVEAICRFLALAPTADMRNFVETAKARDIRTPSAKQVRAGLNASGVGYWRNYERHLQGPIETLKSWIDRFGYA
jgi:tetratricopeptide (TPR) repeat protein